MNAFKRALYQSFVFSIRLYQRLFLDFRVWGGENIPPGPKIYVGNHITSTDGSWVLPVFPEPVHFVLGPVYNLPVLRRLHDAFEHISAMPAHQKTLVPEAVKYLQRGEAVCIAPEGDLHEPFQLGRFYPAVAKIYRQYPVPFVPIGVAAPKHDMREHRWLRITASGRVYRFVTVRRGTYCVNIGEPWMPECLPGSEAKQTLYITRGLRERIEALVEDVRKNKFWLQ